MIRDEKYEKPTNQILEEKNDENEKDNHNPSIDFIKDNMSNQDLDHISNLEKFKTPFDKKEIFKDPEIQEESVQSIDNSSIKISFLASPFNQKIKKILYKDLEISRNDDKSQNQKKTIHDLIYIEVILF